MNRKETAVQLFNNGYNCAQSVLGAFADLLNAKKEVLIDMAAGFGGGMGRLQQTCGALTGGFMVLSSLQNNNRKQNKEKLNQNIQELASRFNERFGALNCKELIPYDLKSPESREKAKRNKVFEKKCTEYVATAVELVESILKENTDIKI